jgi:peroxiredoxin
MMMRFRWTKIAAAVGVAAASASAAPANPPQPFGEGGELIGTPAPPWEATDWINSPPLTLSALRGKVVLVRWFTSTDCPYCSATAPALNELHQTFKDRGLVVVGMYHHKSRAPLVVTQVKGWVRTYAFTFPVAVDRDWQTLRRWWLNGAHRDFTSVSFLIDKKGTIRRIHPGGTMALGSDDYERMRRTVEKLLLE